MKIFCISQGQDIGGQNARIVAGFRKHEPSWSVRSMHVARTYIKYPYDLAWDVDLARQLYAEADVVHHQNRLFSYAMYDGNQRKPALVTYHGPPLRGDADRVNREAKSIGAVQTVSTVDLMADAPHATWTPNFYDLDDLQRRYPRRPWHRLRIGHAPTVREAKGTQAIIKAVNRLSLRHDIQFDLVEGVSWNRSLAHKSRCDIYIDQLTLGYGLSGIEAMALGVPVISGWAEESDRELFMRWTGCSEMPFAHATEETIEDVLEAMIRSAGMREEVAARGSQFVRRWHDEKRGVEQLKGTYISTSGKRTRGVGALELYGDAVKADVVRKWAA